MAKVRCRVKAAFLSKTQQLATSITVAKEAKSVLADHIAIRALVSPLAAKKEVGLPWIGRECCIFDLRCVSM